MQLEIENQNNGGDIIKDIFTKYYSSYWFSSDLMAAPLRYLAFTQYIPDDARDIRAYFPAVPTPPPNC